MENEKLVPELRFQEFKNDGEWKRKTLDSLTIKISDGIHTTPKYNEEGEYYFINGNNLINGNIWIDDKTKRVSEEEYIIHKRDLIKSTILLSINGTIGNIARYNGEKVILGKSACYINVNETKIDKNYITYFIQTNAIKSYFNSELTGSTIKNLSLKSIKETIILLPVKIEEQQKISSCLSSLDEVIAAHSQKLQALKAHKKGLMQNLFPQEGETVPKYRFPEFANDGDWQDKKLGDIADVSKLAGYEFTKHITYEEKGKIIALRGLNIKNNRLELSDVKYIDNSELSKLNRSKLYIDDLMFTYIGTIGEVALIDENNKYYLAPNVSRIRANRDAVQAKFLLQYFNIPFFKDIEISKYISSSSQPALTMENVRKFKILLPSIKEQQKITSCLSSLDALITGQAEKIEQLKLHKKGLMQGLFPKVIE